VALTAAGESRQFILISPVWGAVLLAGRSGYDQKIREKNRRVKSDWRQAQRHGTGTGDRRESAKLPSMVCLSGRFSGRAAPENTCLIRFTIRFTSHKIGYSGQLRSNPTDLTHAMSSNEPIEVIWD